MSSPQVDKINKAVRDRLVKEIGLWGVNQSEAASILGTSQTQVSQLIRGRTPISLDRLLALCAKADLVITVSIPE